MTQVVSPFSSRLLRAARSITDRPGRPRFEFSSKQKQIARHLARDGFSYEEIRRAMGIDLHPNVFRRKLNEINIKASPRRADTASYYRGAS